MLDSVVFPEVWCNYHFILLRSGNRSYEDGLKVMSLLNSLVRLILETQCHKLLLWNIWLFWDNNCFSGWNDHCTCHAWKELYFSQKPKTDGPFLDRSSSSQLCNQISKALYICWLFDVSSVSLKCHILTFVTFLLFHINRIIRYL